MTPFRALGLVVLVSALLCAGCGGDPREPVVAPATPAGVVSAPSSPAPPSVPPSVEEVAAGLAASGLPLTVAVVYTAETDPNGLLGRPGGYTGKLMFTDVRAEPATPDEGGVVQYSVNHGGSVEVYPDAAGAAARAEYVRGFAEGNPALFGEYTYARGPVVLRVSKALTPEQAGGYEEALGGLG